MPSKKTEWAVGPAAGPKVRIAKLANDRLRVTWLCGTSRTFSADDLEAVIWRLEKLDAVDACQWIHEYDSPGYDFQAILHGGRLYAAESRLRIRPDLDDDDNSVRWDGRTGFKFNAEVAIRSVRPLKARAKAALATA